ncbi:protein FAM43A-like [Mytilus californianus]|uniref:protein FAM43A-like n=1 Tax=Mytilus californianus TaxID=6549 RepID=UPI0022470984|nr:protein FAM43A-like [Mytilus californianus]
MFVSSKVRAKITDSDPVFKTRYLGNVEVYVPNGTGCTNAPVQKLWDNSGEERAMNKVTTVINIHGIFMKDSDKKKDEGKLFPIENISFCNAESIANGKIFSWISKEENSPRLLCHAVLCSTPEKAKSMALVMSRAFQIAYKDWKTEQNNIARSHRKDSVKTKTADFDIQLKARYQIDQTGTHDLQNGVQKTKIDDSETEGKAEICMKNGSDYDDSKSNKSSTSSENESVGSKYKDSECQTSEVKNPDTTRDYKEIQPAEKIDNIGKDTLTNDLKDISIQADNTVLKTEDSIDGYTDKISGQNNRDFTATIGDDNIEPISQKL